MSTQHTPGPWSHSKGGKVVSANGWLLASAWHVAKMPDANDDRLDGESWLDARARQQPERDRIEAEMDANARLIAAAPEMLSALRKAVVMLAGVCVHSPELSPHETYEAVSAAIAKATGAAQ